MTQQQKKVAAQEKIKVEMMLYTVSKNVHYRDRNQSCVRRFFVMYWVQNMCQFFPEI